MQFSGSLVHASGRPTITDGTHADRGRDPVGDFWAGVAIYLFAHIRAMIWLSVSAFAAAVRTLWALFLAAMFVATFVRTASASCVSRSGSSARGLLDTVAVLAPR